MRAKRLKIRLFLEGIEIPVISISVSAGVNQPATAAIQVIPTDDVFKLEARTLVHVFFLDLYPSDEAMDAFARAEVGETGSEIQKALGNEYKLLFTGEMHSFSFTRTPSGRQAVLQCLDFSSYWDVAKQYFATGSGSSVASKIAAYVGSASTSFSEDESITPAQMLTNVLVGTPATIPQMGGLLGGVVRLLEIIGGVYRGRGEKFSGLNDFFSAAELRLRLSQTLGASASDTTSKNLFAHKEFKSWLRSILGRNRGPVSFRQIMDVVLARIFHDYTSVLAPALRPAYETTALVKATARKWKAPKNLDPNVKQRIESLEKTLAIGKGTSSTAKEGIAKIDSRYTDIAFNGDGARKAIAEIQRANGAPKDAPLYKAASADESLSDSLSAKKSAAGDDWQPDADDRNEVAAVLAGYKKALKGHSGGGVSKAKFPVMERLVMQVFKPNIYFCAPPRCNVLFPDLYTSFSYRRSYLEEVTRLELKSAGEYDEDSETMKKAKYYAPNIELAAGGKGVTKQFSSTSAKNGTRFLMPHEKFTGIVPSFQNLSDITAFQKIDSAQGGRKKIPYQQRIANFMFFDQRFGPRQASVACPFNPYIVAGMPMLIIDQHVSDSIRSSLGLAPTQYLGVPQFITHMASQEGGTTSITLSHCRTHNERLEHLGGLIHTFQEIVGTSLNSLSVNLTELGSDLTEFYENGGLDNPVKALGIDIPGFAGAKLISTSVNASAVSRVVDGAREGVDLLGINGQDEDVVIGITKTLTRSKAVNVPLDRALFPPWFAPIFTNINIGRDFYQEMLGIGSICDPVQFSGGVSSGVNPFIPSSITASETNALEGKALDSMRTAIKTGLSSPDGKPLQGPPSPNELLLRQQTMKTEIELGMTVEQAVDALVAEYAEVKSVGSSFDEFYKSYSWRPIATMTQMFGDPDFDLTAASAKKAIRSIAGVVTKNDDDSKEGFHSRAYGPYNKLEHLKYKAVQQPGAKGDYTTVDVNMDPRGDRYALVQAYAAVLKSSRGLKG